MKQVIKDAWAKRPSAAAALLFTALLAQAPHAAAVFMRIAPHGAEWEQWTSFVGAWVYAVALESATAYFVWRSQRNWAFAFAAFSIAHNVAYYMPAEWAVDAWGATLQLRNVVGSVLISVSLPIAIAAFSHVQAQHGAGEPTPEYKPAKAAGRPQEGRKASVMDATTTITASEELGANVQASEGDSAPAEPPKLAKAERLARIKAERITDPAAIAAQFRVSLRTAQADLADVREGMVQTNGKGHA